ncbi:ATP-binding protein [Streptomyces sp. NPDC058274]|uniref:ATP-binding protein n=1 Tax=Streptomyces sp. NPDC058274 TaxID=3346416 RepID=UPI0036E39165
MCSAARPDDADATGRCPDTVLVEREGELSVLAELVRATASGRPGLVLLEGPVGIGKSALLRYLADEGRAAGLRVLQARGDAMGREHPFGVARRLFAPLLESADDTGPLWPARAATVADVHRPELNVPAPRGSGTRADDDVSYGVLLELQRFVCRRAAQEPLLLLVDDAQQADPASLRFLAHTARRLAGQPVLLALSRRTDTGVHLPLLDEVAAQPRCRVLRPRPLGGEGVARIVRQITGTDDEEFHSACLAATNGNPLLVRALLAALRHEGRPPTAQSLADVEGGSTVALFSEPVLRVLRKESAETFAAVQAMAVLGDGAPREMCARLAGLDTDVFVQAVLTLATMGLVTATLDGRDWSFSHGLAQEAVLADMPPEQRAGEHRRAARLLLDSGAPAEQVARHLRMTRTPATEAWAVTVLREAAHEATLRGALSHAVELLRLCLPQDAEPAIDPELLVELGLAEARVDTHAGIRHLRLALERVGDARQRLAVLTALSSALVRAEQTAEAVSLLAEHEDAVGAGPGENAQFLQAQRLLLSAWDLPSFREAADGDSLDLGLPGDTPSERALLATRAAIRAAHTEHVEEALAAARRSVGQGLVASDSWVFLATAATALLYADRPGEAAPVFRQLIEAASDTRTEPSFVSLLALRADACHRLGELPEAIAATGAALESAPPERAEFVFALPSAIRIHALLDQGDLAGAADTAGREFDPAAAEGWSWNELLAARGRLHLVQGRPESALADLTECGDRQREWRRTSPAVSSWWFWAGTAHLALGDTRRARHLAEEAVSAARSAGLPSALGRGLGLLAATYDERAGLPLLEEAEAVLAESPAVLELIRVQVARGSALHATGHGEGARKVLRAALDKAYALGARPLYRQARQALLATGARPRRPVSKGLVSLTPSEAEVARHAADGRSNLEIAEALFVTRRTVELHLTSIYRKLGLSGRGELRAVLGGPAGRGKNGPD